MDASWPASLDAMVLKDLDTCKTLPIGTVGDAFCDMNPPRRDSRDLTGLRIGQMTEQLFQGISSTAEIVCILSHRPMSQVFCLKVHAVIPRSGNVKWLSFLAERKRILHGREVIRI